MSSSKSNTSEPSLISRVQDVFYHPFSADALSALPSTSAFGSKRVKAKRADKIPDTGDGAVAGRRLATVTEGVDSVSGSGSGSGTAAVEGGEGLGTAGNRPLVRDYHSINDPEMRAVMPAKKYTAVKVESKVWFANERTWVSYINISILMSTLSIGMYNASRDRVTTWFAYAYGVISIAILIYGYTMFQKRLTMISARDAGQFDVLVGPLLICASLFIAIAANFIFRYREFTKAGHQHP